jgi:hypothetical protein
MGLLIRLPPTLRFWKEDTIAMDAMQIIDELRAVTAKLGEEGIPYALCGGLAMAIYAMPRATLDIDLMIELDSLGRARRAMQDLGFTLNAAPMEFRSGAVQIFRLCKLEHGVEEELLLDLLIVTPETREAWGSRQEVQWGHGRVTVVSPQGLISLKSLRGSGKDRDDIKHLRSIVDEAED